jgi:hypothetical protein
LSQQFFERPAQDGVDGRQQADQEQVEFLRAEARLAAEEFTEAGADQAGAEEFEWLVRGEAGDGEQANPAPQVGQAQQDDRPPDRRHLVLPPEERRVEVGDDLQRQRRVLLDDLLHRGEIDVRPA